MKVYIGPYPKHLDCKIHRDYMNEKYDYDWNGNNTRYERFLEFLEDTIQDYIYTPINRAWLHKREQRTYVKIDYWDTWSMDHTLSEIIVPMLRQLREDKHSAAYVDFEDVPEELRPEGWENISVWDDEDNTVFERWNWVLDEMIFAHESKITDWEEQFHSGEIDHVRVPVDRAGNEVTTDDPDFHAYRVDEGPNHTFELDKEGQIAYYNRMQNGFRLFGKYYQSLWD